MTLLGIFTYYFRVCEVRLNPCEVRLKRTSENSELEKTQISFLSGGAFGGWGEVCEVRFGWRGPLVGGVGYAR